jgi:Domain of unknown function (DUF4112)
MIMRVSPDDIERMVGSTGLVGREPAAVRQRVELMEKLLERLFVVPGINRAVGLDVLLDILPFGGTVIAAAMGSWLIWEARNLDMPKSAMVRMAGNVGFDALLGAIPWLGAIPDFFFRSNTRNLKIIRKHLDRHHPATAVIEG